MKRVLLVSGIQVFPPESGGNLRTAALAQSLAGLGYEVRIYSFTGRRTDYLARRPSTLESPRSGIREYVNRSKVFGFLQWATYRLGLPDLWHLLPLPVPRLLKQWRAESDFVIADFPYLYRQLRGARSSALNSHNLEFERWRVLAPFIRAIEARAAWCAQVIFVTSEHEARFYSETSPASRIVRVPNGVLPERFENTGSREEFRRHLGIPESAKVILFSASQYGPNLEALARLQSFEEENREWLVKQGVVFLVVGSVASEPRRTLGLIATGPVDAVEPYFSVADFAINPVESGSGTNLKMAEYLVARLPVLSTSFGARGFALVPGVDYVSLSEMPWKHAVGRLCELRLTDSRAMAERASDRTRLLVDMRAIVRDAVVPVLDPAY